MAKAKEVVETVVEKIKVELAEIREGLHTIFTKSGSVEFKDGIAEITPEVASELKETGLVK